MKYFRKTCKWPSLFAVSALCMMLVFASGCSKFGKKETAEFKPGDTWLGDMRGRIEATIQDSDRKARMLALVDDTERDLAEMDRIIQQLYTDISALGEDYHTTPEAFELAIAEFEERRSEVRYRVMDTRFKMKEMSTPGEWKKLTDNSKKKGLYKQAVRQPGQ